VAGSIRVVADRRVLWKRVDRNRHQLLVPPAWCCDRDILDQAEAAGCSHVMLRERGTDRYWAAALDAFEVFGFPVQRGHGRQAGLVLDRWTTAWTAEDALQQVDLQAAALRLVLTPTTAPHVVQVSLFTGA